MPRRRYVAFLRGVMPTNAKMSDLRRCFELAAFTDVKTVLSSGNVAFSTRSASEAALERKVEAAMMKHLGRTFYPIIRPIDALRRLISEDPFANFRLAKATKRVVTFLRQPTANLVSLPVEVDGVRILTMTDREVFTGYLPNPKGPVFMTLIAKTFGTQVTTRTWDTIKKCAAA